MGNPTGPVQLGVEDVRAIDKEMADTRHDVNNYLAVLSAALEMIRFRPEQAERFLASAMEQPTRITTRLRQCSDFLGTKLAITQDR
jgi:hypothetical protein